MSQQVLSLLDAIQIAIEAEEKATTFYADAIRKTSNPIGQKLFSQLSEFEGYHVQKLSALKMSLRDGGNFIVYEGRELALPTSAEIRGSGEPSKLSVMAILELAIQLERTAEKQYTSLAARTAHPDGHAMFARLATEEHTHYRILDDAYSGLNDRGEWNWLGRPPRGKSKG